MCVCVVHACVCVCVVHVCVCEREREVEEETEKLCFCPLQTTALGSNLTVNTSDGAGVTPAHRAAQLGRRRVMELLLSHGATINCRTSDQLTPLHLACQYNHKDVSVRGQRKCI